MSVPRRIVCLSAETVETLYLIGAADRIVGVTGYATRPARVRREKTRIGAFSTADAPAILALEPDLVLTFSDVQADLAAALIRGGIAVHAFNQRSLGGILAMIATLGRLVERASEADRLVADCETRLAAAKARAARQKNRPRVYFEEWDDPPVAGIGWVSELIDAAGGVDVFALRAQAPAAHGRIVTPEAIVAAAPDIIVASWCGKKFRPEAVRGRPGFGAIPAVRDGALHALPAPILLQPGPAVFSEGLPALEAIIAAWPPGGARQAPCIVGGFPR